MNDFFDDFIFPLFAPFFLPIALWREGKKNPESREFAIWLVVSEIIGLAIGLLIVKSEGYF